MNKTTQLRLAAEFNKLKPDSDKIAKTLLWEILGNCQVSDEDCEIWIPQILGLIQTASESKSKEYKEKSDKWDELNKKVWEAYGYWDESGEWIEYDDGDPRGKDLAQIGEMVAHVFGLI